MAEWQIRWEEVEWQASPHPALTYPISILTLAPISLHSVPRILRTLVKAEPQPTAAAMPSGLLPQSHSVALQLAARQGAPAALSRLCSRSSEGGTDLPSAKEKEGARGSLTPLCSSLWCGEVDVAIRAADGEETEKWPQGDIQGILMRILVKLMVSH